MLDATKLVVAITMMTMVKSQDLSDCAWHPDPDQAILQCNLKTLQTGPADIPQVNNWSKGPKKPVISNQGMIWVVQKQPTRDSTISRVAKCSVT